MSVNPDGTPGPVATGELIESAWGNAVATTIGKLPKGFIGYAFQTSNLGGFTNTVADLAGLTVTFNAVAGRYYKVTGDVYINSSVAGDTGQLIIADGANTQLQASQVDLRQASISIRCHVQLVVAAATTGSTTRKLRMSRSAGTGTLTMAAASNFPAFILVEDIGKP